MNCPHCQATNDEASEVCFACGRGIHALTQGALLADRYEIRKALGTGGMGTVYLAHDRALDELVAVKVLKPSLASSPEMTARFRSEIKLARKVAHTNVCRIYEYGVDGLRHYISMEYVDGPDLRALVSERGGLPREEAFDVAVQVSQGLQAIHDAGIIHRDLKASNIMIDATGTVRLLDFGIAKQSSGERTAAVTQSIIGTPEYMSPEQALGAGLDFRSDVYSLAVVIYEIFTGRVPFEGQTPAVTMFMHVKDPPPLDGGVAARLPPALVSTLRKALSKDRTQRHATARGVTAELRRARSAGSGGATVAEPADEDESPRAARALQGFVATSSAPADGSTTVVLPRSPAPATGLTQQVKGWVEALRDPQAPARWRAAAALWEIGPAAAAAAPALSAALLDSDPSVARAAAEALKRITGGAADVAKRRPSVGGQTGSSVPPALLAALEHGDGHAREEAATALGSLSSPKLAVPPLVHALQDAEPAVRAAAAASLVQIGAALAAAREPDATANRPVITGLVAALAAALNDAAVVVRRRAARGLGQLGPAALGAIPRLIEALQDEDASVAHTAAFALESMVGAKKAAGPATDAAPAAPSMSPALSTLISGLKHGDASVRWRAAVALGGLGAGAVVAVPDLVDLLDDETEIIRWEAAKALGRMGASAKDAVPALAATLHGQEDAIVRRSAAEALGRIGAAADDGVPALIAALRDSDVAVAEASEQALLRIGRAAVSALIEAVKDDDAAVRLKAAEIVTKLGTDWSASPASSSGIVPEPAPPWERKRRSPRLQVGVALRLRRLTPRGSEGAEELTVTENLSEGGAKLVTSLPVEKGEIVELHEPDGPLHIKALVLNVSIGQDNRPRLHLQFFEVEGAEHLKELLAQADPSEEGDPSQRATS